MYKKLSIKNVLFAVFVLFSFPLWGQADPRAGGDARHFTMAVLDFLNQDGSRSLLGQTIANEAVHYFINNSRITVVERTQISRVLEEQHFASTGLVSDESAAQLGGILGANAVMFGALTPLGNKVRLLIKVVDTTSARVLSSRSVELKGAKYLRMYREVSPAQGVPPAASDKRVNSDAAILAAIREVIGLDSGTWNE
jgi:TolB-like protein